MKKILSILLFLFITSNCFAATQLLKTVKPSGGDYTSLEACMHANEQDLTVADKYFDVEIDGDWSGGADTTVVTLHLYTTDATRYINVYTTATARHNGSWSTSKYILQAARGNNGLLLVQQTNVYLDGLQIYNTTADAGGLESAILFGLNATIANRVSNCILRGARYPLRNEDPGTLHFWNNIIYGGGQGAILGNDSSGIIYVYSSTCIGAVYGIRNLAGTMTAKNCYATTFTGTITQTTNASTDASATGTALDNIAYSTDNFTNVTAGSEDLHLVVDSALIDVGTDTSGESAPLNFTDDIDGVTRTGTWDIGADEFVSAVARRFFIFD